MADVDAAARQPAASPAAVAAAAPDVAVALVMIP